MKHTAVLVASLVLLFFGLQAEAQIYVPPEDHPLPTEIPLTLPGPLNPSGPLTDPPLRLFPLLPPALPPTIVPSGGDDPPPRPSYRTFVLPAICTLVDINEVNDACDIVAAARFGWELTDAKGNMRSFDEVTRLLAEAAGPTIFVGLVFPGQASLASKIDVVQSIYASQVAFFQAMQERIQTTMIENPNSQAARRAGAIASSQNYVRLTQQASDEARRSSIETVNYLQSEPRTSRVQARCFTACGQLIHIYRTGSGFD